jgi:hypothetical protein
MISDVLAEASSKIQSYLDLPNSAYKGAMRERIKQLVVEMKTIQGELDTPPQSKPINLSVSPALPLSSPSGGILPEGVGYTDTQHGQMVRQLKQFTTIHGGQFITDCLSGQEAKYLKQHQEKQVVEPLAKWLRLLLS